MSEFLILKVKGVHPLFTHRTEMLFELLFELLLIFDILKIICNLITYRTYRI